MKKISHILLLFSFFILPAKSQDRKKIDTLRAFLSGSLTDTARITVLNDLGFEYQKILPDSALLLARQALALSEKINYRPGTASSLHNIGNVYYFKADFNRALSCYQRALDLRRLLDDKKGIAKTTGTIGNVHFAQGNYEQALAFYQDMLKVAQQSNDRAIVGDALGNVANVMYSLGKYDKSLEYNLQSLKIREEINDKRGMEHSYNNIGGIYFAQGNALKALEYLSKALELQQSMGNKKGISDSYENMGNIYFRLDSLDKASDYFTRSLKITMELGNKAGIANAYDNLGSVYKKKKEFARAIDYHRKALKLAEEIGDQKGMANAYGNLGEDYILTHDFAAAARSISKTLGIGKKTGARYYIKNAYDYFVMLYRSMNEPAKALEYYELSSSIGDSLLNEENTRSIAEMQARYDTEKKQKELQLLQKNKSIQELQLSGQDAKNYRLRLLIYSLAGGLLLLTALCFFIQRSTREKKKINEALERKNNEIQLQKEIIEQKNLLITDSIDYARSLIESRLPSASAMGKMVQQHFVFERAKEIVSGTAWWMQEMNGKLIIVVADCGKPGVPGAFLVVRLLNRLELLLESLQPLNAEQAIQELSREPAESVDAAVMIIDRKRGEAELFCNNVHVYFQESEEKNYVQLANGLHHFAAGAVFLFCTKGFCSALGGQEIQRLAGCAGEDLFASLRTRFSGQEPTPFDMLAFGIKL